MPSWTPVCLQSIRGLVLACTQSVARGQTSALPAGSTADEPTGAPQQPGADGKTSTQDRGGDGAFQTTAALQHVSSCRKRESTLA